MNANIEIDLPDLEEFFGDVDDADVLEDAAAARMLELREARDDADLGLPLVFADRNALGDTSATTPRMMCPSHRRRIVR